MNNICFVIAHRYTRGYKNYLDHYIDNIKKAYGEEALTVVTDNNSQFKDESFDRVKHHSNVVLLDNNIKGKFEIGGYTVGLKHILDNNLKDKYEYYVFTQDTFVFKNKYDFNKLLNDNIWACPINDMPLDNMVREYFIPVLEHLGLCDNLDKCSFVWANSFIVHKSKIEQLYGYFKQINCTHKVHSQAAERFLARIMFELNEHGENVNIDGDLRGMDQRHYDCWKVDPVAYNGPTHFVKAVQNKNEGTQDQ